VTSEEGAIGKGHLSKFQDLETTTPVILTTSQLLTTGVDIPTCKNIVIARVVNSMVEFKQIIGRGTRVETITTSSFSISSTTPAPQPVYSPTPILTASPRTSVKRR
jgi:type I site-specific restriction endonuclease